MAELGRRAPVLARIAAAVPVALPGRAGMLGRLLGALNIWFWTIVGLPTLIAGVYYFAIASDLYMSEARFVVRGPHQAGASPGSIAAMLGANGGLDGTGDAAEVKEFILSRDAVRDLDQHDGLRTVFARPEGDFLTRFPGIEFWRRDFEALYKTYSRFVTVQMDPSGIATLQVKAYRPEDAQHISQALMRYSERLINELNARAREDTLATFQNVVQQAEQHIAQVQDQLTAYRVKEKMLAPKSSATAPLGLVAGLEKELAAARGQLAEMQKNAPRSPGVPLLRTRIDSLESLIAGERTRITGESNSVATKTGEFERLDGQRVLGEKALASAFASLEQARLQLQQQQLYLEEIAQPNLPDYPLYPKRIGSFALVVASCFLAYGIAWL